MAWCSAKGLALSTLWALLTCNQKTFFRDDPPSPDARFQDAAIDVISKVPPAIDDADGDGLSDQTEGRDAKGGAVDTDGDSEPDYLDSDSDADALSDAVEGAGDIDGDGIADWRDPLNSAGAPILTLVAISTMFNTPIGIDYHQPTNTVIMSVYWSSGSPYNFERVEFDGTHAPFSDIVGLTDEVKIGTVRAAGLKGEGENPAGFVAGDMFVGNGSDGQIVRITDGGLAVINPWVDLPGSNGLMRGSLYVDRTGAWGYKLIVVTTIGQVWVVDAAGTPTLIADIGGVHLEGVAVVPNAPIRFGPLAGKILAGAEQAGLLYVFDELGNITSYNVGVNIEDIDLVSPRENFFGVNFGSGSILGAEASQFDVMVGDILLTQETHDGSGLFRLAWDGATISAEPIQLSAESAPAAQWEHVTFAPAGIVEVPPIE